MRSHRRSATDFAVALVVTVWTSAAAEVTEWRINAEGRGWESETKVSTAIDFSTPGSIQIAGFRPSDNIVQSLNWISNRPAVRISEERPDAHIWNNDPLKDNDIVMVDGDPETSTEDRFKRFGSNQAGKRFDLDLGSRFPVNRIVFFPRLTGEDSDGIPYSESYIRGYEVHVNNGSEDLPLCTSTRYQMVPCVQCHWVSFSPHAASAPSLGSSGRSLSGGPENLILTQLQSGAGEIETGPAIPGVIRHRFSVDRAGERGI